MRAHLNIHNLLDDLVGDRRRLLVNLRRGILLRRIQRDHRLRDLRVDLRLGLVRRGGDVGVHLRLHRRDFGRDFSARIRDDLFLLRLRTRTKSHNQSVSVPARPLLPSLPLPRARCG